jgi:chromosome segregation ATPase
MLRHLSDKLFYAIMPQQSESTTVTTSTAAIKDTIKSTTTGLISTNLNEKKAQFRAIESKLKKQASIESNLKSQLSELQTKNDDSLLTQITEKKTELIKLENNIKILVTESKSLFEEISKIQYTLSSLENNEDSVKEETIKILNNMSDDHKKIVLEQMMQIFSESMNDEYNWTRMSNEQQIEPFLNHFIKYVGIETDSIDSYRNLLMK